MNSNFCTIWKTGCYTAVQNLNLFGLVVDRLLTKEVWTVSTVLHEKMGQRDFSCSPTWLPPFQPIKIFYSLSVCDFDIFRLSSPNFGKTSEVGSFTYCKNFMKIAINLNYWWRHCRPRILLAWNWSFSTRRKRNNLKTYLCKQDLKSLVKDLFPIDCAFTIYRGSATFQE